MNDKSKTDILFPTSLSGVLVLFLSWFFPWVEDPYSRHTLKPIRYIFQGVDLFSIILWLQAILAIFIFVLALKKSRSRGLSRVTGVLVIIDLLILNFPALDSETRLPAGIGLGSILALLAAVLFFIPERSGIFSFLRKQKETDIPQNRTIIYLGILLFLSCWLPWTRGYYSWFGKNLIDLLPGHKYIFYFPLLFVVSSSVLVLWGFFGKDARIPAFASGTLFMVYFFYSVLLGGILQMIYSRSIGFFAAFVISCALLWTALGKKISRDSIQLKNLLRIDVLFAAILAVVFPLNIFPAHDQYSMPKLNPLFELFVFVVPLFAVLSILLALIGKKNRWAGRTAGWLALFFLISYFLVAGFYVIFLLKSIMGVLEIIASVGLIVIPAEKRKEMNAVN